MFGVEVRILIAVAYSGRSMLSLSTKSNQNLAWFLTKFHCESKNHCCIASDRSFEEFAELLTLSGKFSPSQTCRVLLLLSSLTTF